MNKILLTGLLLLLSVFSFSQPDNNQHLVNCDPAWQYAIIGMQVGDRTLNTVDIDNSGTTVVLCGAGNYWYILHYNVQRQDYEYLWISEHYQAYITRINVFDINNDNIMEIFVGFNDGSLKVYTGDTRQLLKSFPASSSYLDEIRDIEFGDIDNDGSPELAVSTYSSIKVYKPEDFSIEMILPYAAHDFKIANVDNDAELELITSQGYVLECSQNNTVVEWIFNPGLTDDSYRIKVSDIDQDGKGEIFYTNGGLNVYDADLQTTKFVIYEDNTINDFVVRDVNNDGIKEIIYGENTWDYDLHCINSLNQNELWVVTAQGRGIADVCVSDLDGDGQLELLFGSGTEGGGAHKLEIFNINTQAREWQSRAEDGPFRAIDIEDVDDDGVKELVAISYKSSNGYRGGILSVFNAITHETEWQSDDMLFDNSWTGINDVKVADIDNDGKKEIIVAGGEIYNGEIWVLDGITKAIKSTHVYTSNEINWAFANFTVDDVDSDGQLEIIATTGYSYYVINPLNYSIKYSSPVFGYEGLTLIKTGNLNADHVKDVVLNRYKLTVFNGLTHQMIESSGYSVSSFDLFDWNGDGIEEIIAGTYSGKIMILNGLTLQPIDTVNTIGGMIDALVVSDLNKDGVPEIVYSTAGRVYFYATDTQYGYTRLLDDSPGESTTLVVEDINGDHTNEVFSGTKHKIIEFSEDCYRCIWFAMTKISDDASCGAADGYVQLMPYGGQVPYSCSWNNGMTGNMISGLATGNYTANLVDQQGCVIIDTTVITQSVLLGNIEAMDESCNPSGNGTASITISEGRAPYTYTWNNGSTTSAITNLHKGTYSAQVRDMKNCTLDLETTVNKDTLLLEIYKSDVKCFGGLTGSINIYPSSGSYPFTYLWDNGKTTGSQYNIPAGNYTVTVYDAEGCISGSTITITEPSAIILNAYSTPDDPLTSSPEGTATVNAIGGVPPYSVRWDDPLQQTTVKAINLTNDIYHAYVSDSHHCIQSITVKVGDPYGISENEALAGIVLFPNPTTGMMYIDFGTLKSEVIISVFDELGKPVSEFCKGLNSTAKFPLDLTGLEQGFYFLIIRTTSGMRGFKIEIVK